MKLKLLTAAVLILTLGVCWESSADEGSAADSIKLGQSCALSGPTKDMGVYMYKGAKVYFDHINATGGIHGRKIEHIILNDGYEPNVTVSNTENLIKEKNVIALFGQVGTPTSKVAVPIAEKYNVPFIMPLTGAEFLRVPHNKLVVNFRAGYEDEIKALIDYITENKGVKKIAIFYQDDDYGKAGLTATKKVLQNKGMELVSSETYVRNFPEIPKETIDRVKSANPDAVIMVGAYLPCANFIKGAKKSGMTGTLFCNISFVGSESLVQELQGATDNVLISQVVPLPWDVSNAGVQEYQNLFRKAYPGDKFGFVSLEGFLAAKLTVKALQKAGPNPTREDLIKALESLEGNELEGLTLSLGREDHQAMDTVYLTSYENGDFREIKRVTLSK